MVHNYLQCVRCLFLTAPALSQVVRSHIPNVLMASGFKQHHFEGVPKQNKKKLALKHQRVEISLTSSTQKIILSASLVLKCHCHGFPCFTRCTRDAMQLKPTSSFSYAPWIWTILSSPGICSLQGFLWCQWFRLKLPWRLVMIFIGYSQTLWNEVKWHLKISGREHKLSLLSFQSFLRLLWFSQGLRGFLGWVLRHHFAFASKASGDHFPQLS